MVAQRGEEQPRTKRALLDNESGRLRLPAPDERAPIVSGIRHQQDWGTLGPAACLAEAAKRRRWVESHVLDAWKLALVKPLMKT